MTDKTRYAIAAATFVLTFSTVFHLAMQRQVVDGFPALNPKKAKKAYNRLFLLAIRGKLTETIKQGDDAITAVFLEIYYDLP
ncbi:MAG TPA: hypothetical protein PKD16_02145 [Saprospiraceae bacterium]|jgi:hypothetical protein|nr:hypothetical protein [Saprospiraceae bacterium]